MIDGFHLLRPDALWLLLICPLIAWSLWNRRIEQGDWGEVIEPHLLAHLRKQRSSQAFPSKTWIPLIAIVLTILAIAGPSVKKIELPVLKRADALVIVLDLSASMLAADIKPSRVKRAQQKILDLLDRRVEGTTGLVVFSGDAHVVTPLTDDNRTIANLLPALSPHMMPLPGADANSGIKKATELLVMAGARGGQILVITDGLRNFKPKQIKNELKNSDATLAILAIGTRAGAPIPLIGGGFLKDESGEIVIPFLNQREIKNFAAELDARYQEVTLNEDDLDSLTNSDLFDHMADLTINRQADDWQDQGFWLAVLVALILLPGFRGGALTVIGVVLLMQSEFPRAAEWSDLWLTGDQQGSRLLTEGDASGAAEQFTDPKWQGIAEFEAGKYDRAADLFAEDSSSDAFFNKGNALALEGDLQGAVSAYEQSLAIQPDAKDALANRDFVLSILEKKENQERNQKDQQRKAGEDKKENNKSQRESMGSSDSKDRPSEITNRKNGSQRNDTSPSGQRETQEQIAQQTPEEPSQANPSEIDSQTMRAETQKQMAKFDEALEDQQALEQWLRRVPDDPGGLLRRKFRYETMQRLRNGAKPDETIRW